MSSSAQTSYWTQEMVSERKTTGNRIGSEYSTETNTTLFDGVRKLPSVLSTNRKKHLLKLDDMPDHLKFNPFVLSGYRPLLSLRECFQSLFYFHNETINIATHGLPILFIVLLVPRLLPWQEARFLSWCHLCGILCPWIGSVCYHLFMNWQQGGNRFYQRLLTFDMLGVWICQSFGAFPMLAVSCHCMHPSIKTLFFLSYCLFCAWGLFKAMSAWSPWERRFCFIFPFVMRTLIYVLRAMGVTGGHRDALAYVFLQDYLSLVGGVIGAAHVPERWFPGIFDFFLNSHNIMHVLVLIAVYFMHKATMLDFQWLLASNDC